MDNDGYDLKWKNHLNEVFGVVRKLRVKDAFSDVIVHCGGKNFPAHKVILAASSAFFERVLSGLPDEKAKVLVMTETRPDLLRLLLDFIYNGEAFVRADVLEDFMTTAEKLEIRGLRKESDVEDSSSTTSRDAPARESKKRPATQAVKSEDEVDSPVGAGNDDDGDDDPLAKRAKKTAAGAPKKLPGVPSHLVIESASASDSGSSRPPTSRVTTHGGLQIKPAPRKSDQAGPSRPQISVSRPSTSNDDEDIVEVEEDGTVKTENEETNYDYSNDGTEWTEEGGYGDEEYYDEGAEGEQGNYDESYAAGEGDEQPQNIPPEISTEHPLVLWRPGSNIWRGLDRDFGVPRYLCGFCCQYSTTNSAHARYHTRTHTGEKPYVCSVCWASFAQKSNLRGHCVAHHGGKGENGHSYAPYRSLEVRNEHLAGHGQGHGPPALFVRLLLEIHDVQVIACAES